MEVKGWVEEIRDLGGIRFILLHTTDGDVQITLHKKKIPKKLFNSVDAITRQSAISVTGKFVRNKQAPGGKELIPKKIEVLGLAETPLPLDPAEKRKADIDTRLDWRFLDFRSERSLAIFKIQNEILKSFRSYLNGNDFLEIQPPAIISSASEGGAELFAIPYFEKEAFLAQSPQLYKQMSAVGFGKVFMVTPVWRAEKFNKPTHINEIRQMDIEMAFVEDEEDVIKILEETFVHMLKSIKKNCSKELKTIGVKLNVPKLPLRRVTYTRCIERLKKAGEKIKWGEDFSKSQEKKLGEFFGEAFILKEWPSAAKAFYTMPYQKNPKVCRAFDLVYKGIEICSGTQRVHKPELLIKKIKEKGMKPENFKYYIDCFRYGAPPHAGWSIGLERLTMTITGVDNIREATMFPRDRNRLTP